jgi:5-methylcytosine-specific restriction endonuclease McrA
MPRAVNGIKICTKCNCAKSVSEFHKDKRNKDGLMIICIKCKREYRISPFYKAREKELEKTPRYKSRKKRFGITEKGKFNYSKEDHRSVSRKYNINVEHTLSFVEWNYILIMQNHRCAICMRVFSEDMKAQKDCIIPLSKGGALTFKNAQALCRHCNSSKNTSMYSGLGNRWRSKIKEESF